MAKMLEGQARVLADRLWRDPDAQKRFQEETGFVPGDHDYNDQFRDWAADQIDENELE